MPRPRAGHKAHSRRPRPAAAGAGDRDRAAGLLDRRDRRRRGAGDARASTWRSARPWRAAGCRRACGARRPDATSTSSVISAEASSLPASMNFWIRPRLMTAYSLRFGLLKPRLGRRMVERHLAALVGVDRHARAGLLALDAAAGGLALARAGTAARRASASWSRRDCRAVRSVSCRFSLAGNAAPSDGRPAHGGEWGAAADGRPAGRLSRAPRRSSRDAGSRSTMPRTEGVSSSSRVLCILFRPRPIRVWRCTAGRRIGEPICLTTMVLRHGLRPPPASAAASAASGCGRMSATFLPRRCATERGDALALQAVDGGADHVVGVLASPATWTPRPGRRASRTRRASGRRR